MHTRIEAGRNAIHKQTLTELVKRCERFTTQIARAANDELLEFHAAEPIPHHGLDDSQDLADPGLPAPNPVTGMSRRGEPGDQRPVQVEERADPASSWTCLDLGDGIVQAPWHHRFTVSP
jgi:hypothetical protein